MASNYKQLRLRLREMLSLYMGAEGVGQLLPVGGAFNQQWMVMGGYTPQLLWLSCGPALSHVLCCPTEVLRRTEPQFPVALTCSLTYTALVTFLFSLFYTPASVSWDHLLNKPLLLATLSHDQLLEKHSL